MFALKLRVEKTAHARLAQQSTQRLSACFKSQAVIEGRRHVCTSAQLNMSAPYPAWDTALVPTRLVRPEKGQPGCLEGAPGCHLLRGCCPSRALAKAPEADPVAAAHRQLLPAVRSPCQRANLRLMHLQSLYLEVMGGSS